MPGGGIRGLPLAYVAVGGVLVFSGLENVSVAAVLRSLARGQRPAPGPGQATAAQSNADQLAAAAGTTNVAPPTSAAIAGYQAFARLLLAKHGWAGQWSSFNSIVMAESGWNSRAFNPSGAWGIAQALGHGTAATDAGNGHNEYGNFGTSDAICKAANGGSGTAQVEWMLNYIGDKYGSPDAAWAYHQANNSY